MSIPRRRPERRSFKKYQLVPPLKSGRAYRVAARSKRRRLSPRSFYEFLTAQMSSFLVGQNTWSRRTAAHRTPLQALHRCRQFDVDLGSGLGLRRCGHRARLMLAFQEGGEMERRGGVDMWLLVVGRPDWPIKSRSTSETPSDRSSPQQLQAGHLTVINRRTQTKNRPSE